MEVKISSSSISFLTMILFLMMTVFDYESIHTYMIDKNNWNIYISYTALIMLSIIQLKWWWLMFCVFYFLENHSPTLVLHGRHQTAGRSLAAQFHLIWQSRIEANQKIKYVLAPSVTSLDPSPVITVIHIFNLHSDVFLLSIGILGCVCVWRGHHLKLVPSVSLTVGKGL